MPPTPITFFHGTLDDPTGRHAAGVVNVVVDDRREQSTSATRLAPTGDAGLEARRDPQRRC